VERKREMDRNKDKCRELIEARSIMMKKANSSGKPRAVQVAKKTLKSWMNQRTKSLKKTNPDRAKMISKLK
jgi:hypothetical protein